MLYLTVPPVINTQAAEVTETTEPILIESEGVTVSVRYGIGQQARYGRKVVITADVSSKNLSGTYTLNFYFGDRQNENVKYGVDVVLQEGEITTAQVTIPVIKEILNMKTELVSNDGETVVEAVNSFHVTNFGTYKLVGILTGLSNDLSYLNTFGSKTYYMNESNFPSDKDGLDILDVIVVNDFDTNGLSSHQMNALERFVSEGGTLVLGTGNKIDTLGAFLDAGMFRIDGISATKDLQTINVINREVSVVNEETFPKLLEAINTYENNRISELSKIEERKASYGIDLRESYVGDSMITGTLLSELKQEKVKKDIAIFDVEGASNYLVDGNLVLVQKLKYNKGTILISSFDLSMGTEDATDNQINTSYLEIAKLIYGSFNSAYLQKLELESYGNINSLSNYGVKETSDNSGMPGIGSFLIILLLYVCIVGPGIFLVLRRLEKSKYIWIVAPFCSVLFILLIYFAGLKTRITEPYVAYLSIERYDDKTQQMMGEVSFDLSFPTNKKSEISLQNVDTVTASEVSFPPYSIYYNDRYNTKQEYIDLSTYQTGFIYREDEVVVESLNTPAFSKSNIEASYSYASEPLIVGTVAVNEQNISGFIQNVTDSSINEAYLYSEGILVSLGTIESGESIEIENLPSENLMNVEMIYYSKLIDELLQYDEDEKVVPSTSRKNQAMRSLTAELQIEENAAYVISFSDVASKDNPIYDLSNNKGSYGTNMRLVPIDVEYMEGDSLFVPNIDRYIDVSEGYQYIYNYRYMMSDVMEVQYYFPKNDTITELMVTELYNRTIAKENSTKLCKYVYLYNYEVGEYELVFDLSKLLNETNQTGTEGAVQSVSEEELEKYLTSDNILKVKYSHGYSLDDIAILPHISYRKEAPYAAD